MHATVEASLSPIRRIRRHVHTSYVAPVHGAGPPLTAYGVHVSNKGTSDESQQSGTWAAVIKARRKALGWSQARLAEEGGVDRATILRWEQGRMSNPEKVASVALVLGIDPVDAFRWIGFLPAAETAEPETDPELLELERQMATARRAMQAAPDPALRARFARQLTDLTASFNDLVQHTKDADSAPSDASQHRRPRKTG